MKSAGYSPEYSNNPQRLMKSDAFQDLLEKELPDDLLAKVHRDGLHATIKGKPDYSVRHKYLVTGYEVRKKITKDGPSVFMPVQMNFGDERQEFA